MTNVYLSNHEGYHISTIDDCFLLSDWEVFGKQSLDKDMWVDLPADGKQYPGILSTNLKYMGKCNSINCWLRTSLIGITSCANFIKTCGDDTHCVDIPSTDGGITPAFCL
jgi:hypothetical protein